MGGADLTKDLALILNKLKLSKQYKTSRKTALQNFICAWMQLGTVNLVQEHK
jgi:hypothetical protein